MSGFMSLLSFLRPPAATLVSPFQQQPSRSGSRELPAALCGGGAGGTRGALRSSESPSASPLFDLHQEPAASGSSLAPRVSLPPPSRLARLRAFFRSRQQPPQVVLRPTLPSFSPSAYPPAACGSRVCSGNCDAPLFAPSPRTPPPPTPRADVFSASSSSPATFSSWTGKIVSVVNVDVADDLLHRIGKAAAVLGMVFGGVVITGTIDAVRYVAFRTGIINGKGFWEPPVPEVAPEVVPSCGDSCIPPASPVSPAFSRSPLPPTPLAPPPTPRIDGALVVAVSPVAPAVVTPAAVAASAGASVVAGPDADQIFGTQMEELEKTLARLQRALEALQS